MGKINMGRAVSGGLLAGLILNIGKYLLNDVIWGERYSDALAALHRSLPTGAESREIGSALNAGPRDYEDRKAGQKQRKGYFMKRKVFSMSAVVLLGLLASAWAADITGKWTVQSSGQQGDFQITLIFKVDGTKVTGTLDNSQMPGEIAIKEGKLNGDEISFFVLRKMGDSEMKIVWKGKIAAEEIKFTREAQGGGMMGGAGGGAGAPAEELIAKRAK